MSGTYIPVFYRLEKQCVLGNFNSLITLKWEKVMNEIFFLVKESPEGGYEAEALGQDIFTEADTLNELKAQVKDAVNCHFDKNIKPALIRTL